MRGARLFSGAAMDFEEFVHIAISVVTISLAFTYVFEPRVEAFLTSFVVVLATVGVGFIAHELGHRWLARRYGCFAVYRAFLPGLILALVMAVAAHIIFAIPGAVVIFGPHLTREQNGKIAFMGPLMNGLLALGFLALAYAGWQEVGVLGWRVNYILGIFNLLPVDPIDGAKIIRWSILSWVALTAALLGIALLPA